jgi:putative inorganic carbon (HCO3(-)) transporter
MRPQIPVLAQAAVWLTFGSAAAIVLSIAASQILLGAALLALILSGEPLRLPRIKLPLAIFIAGTLLAWLASGDLKTGLPQIKKLIVFFELLIVYSCLRSTPLVRKLMLTWAALGTFTACFGFIQFGEKVAQAHRLGRDFYNFYVAARIKGFTSHWNTFSAEEMFVLLMLAAFLLFAPKSRRQWLWILCAALLSVSVVLIETRGVWIALLIAMAYLIWRWRRWVVLLIPAVAILAFAASPAAIRERFQSILHAKDVDSNEFHVVVWRTGLRMIESHPLLGLGPEQQRVQFDRYMPADIHKKPIGFYGHLHNLYLEYAAERGIPVLLVFLWMIAWILLDFSRGLRALPPGPSDRRFILEGAIAVVTGALVEGFFEVNLGDSEPLTMFLIAVACGYLALDPELERLPIPSMFRVGVESHR